MGEKLGVSRRRFITGAAAAATMGVASSALGAQRGAATGSRPNILLIVTDDHPKQTDWAMQETLSWLGEHGITYANGHCTTPLCAPSRASIFSGRYAHNHGVRSNLYPHNLDQSTTVQSYLRLAGYRTGLFGKYLNTWSIQDSPPHFDEWAMLQEGYLRATFNINGTVQQINRYTTTVIRNRALRFIEEAAKDPRPWFAYVAPYAPHKPNVPARRHAQTAVPPWSGRPSVFETDKSDKPPYVQASNHTLAEGQAARQRQLRSLLSLDDTMKTFRNKLAAVGQLNNTLVLYVGDNGRLWGDHGRLAKGVPYRPAHEVPFYLSWPAGGLAGGTVDNHLVANIDIAPTILDAAGVTPDTPQDGQSLLSTHSRDRLLTEWWAEGAVNGGPPSWASSINTTRQYVEYYDLKTDAAGRAAGTGTVLFREYYDLVDDPYQLNNLLYKSTAATERALGIAALSRQLAADRAA